MAGRTLLQQALPTTFGLKAAGWLDSVVGARERLASVSLAVQLGGAAGTLAALGSDGERVVALLAERLGLDEPPVPWHTARLRVAELGSALALAAGVLEKIALDLVLLSQTEVGEVAEPAAGGRGGSSTLPHKRNPVGSVLAIACARRVRGAAGVLLEAMPQEHERAAGAWQSEWAPLSEALGLTGGAASALREALEGLEVRPERMRGNLDATGGLLMAESVVGALAERAGPAARAGAGRCRRGASARRGKAAARRAGRRRGGERRPLRGGDRPGARSGRLPGLGRCLRRPRPVTLSGGIVSVDVDHTLEGPDGAPVVVFSNSLGTTGQMWDAQAAALSERPAGAPLRHARSRRDAGARRPVHGGRARPAT